MQSRCTVNIWMDEATVIPCALQGICMHSADATPDPMRHRGVKAVRKGNFVPLAFHLLMVQR
jgi:hypothetical protein